MYLFFFFFNDTATTEIYTLSLHDALPIYDAGVFEFTFRDERFMPFEGAGAISVWELSLPENLRPFEYHTRSEEHTSELQSQSNLVCRLLLEKKTNSTRHVLHRIPPVERHS